MNRLQILKSALIGGASVLTLVNPAAAKVFNIPDGDLATALEAYVKQAGVEIVYVDDAVRGHRSRGAKGDYTETAALTQVLRGTGFAAEALPLSSAIGIVPERHTSEQLRVAQAARRAPAAPVPVMPAAVETVVVTAQKKSENIQNVPIAVTALSQAQLTERQIAGGPDLVKEVPNLTFSKTNFTGYNIQIRGIGTQAISVTTDPAVAVALNGTPFIRNHFFEQEFFDVQDVEVLRGPQGTLYGRNATAGVVNVKSALPTGSYEAMLSADLGNFSNRRLEAMLNLPIVGDKLDLRIAGEWTRRDGYSFNELTGQPIDGRDLWSSRVTLAWKPTSDIQAYLVWEHFSENDDRMRSAKQLCKTAPIPASVDGVPVPAPGIAEVSVTDLGGYFTQGCLPTSLYSPDAFEVPNGYGLPYVAAGIYGGELNDGVDPYAGTTQSPNLRVIESAINPTYRAKNDTLELNVDYDLTPALTITSQTGYNQDFLWSTEDYNRFNTSPGIFVNTSAGGAWYFPLEQYAPNGVFCDPQVGCSNRLVAEDLSNEHAWQLSQEFRLASNFDGPLNFSLGGNYLHYETEENYYVFINALTAFTFDTADLAALYPAMDPWTPGVTDGHQCLAGVRLPSGGGLYQYPNPAASGGAPGDSSCAYIDPNPIGRLNNEGHNYFLSQNPYVLNSYAMFGEAYYQLAQDLKLTTGLRWTEDQKHFIDIPSEVVTNGYGYPATGIVDQQWDQFTGRFTADWTPKLDFTDQTLVYGSYAHGYKAGGANPPGARLDGFQGGDIADPVHPLIFKPEFIEAFELGSKNTLLDGKLTLNGDIFFYDYRNYQISEIVDRTSINLNFNATVHGAELESTWEPLPGLKFSFAGGFEGTRLDNGQSAVDLIDRTAGMPGWMVIKPFISQTSNCILPDYVIAASLQNGILNPDAASPGAIVQVCGAAYNLHQDPVTDLAYVANPTVRCTSVGAFGNGSCSDYGPISGYAGFDPSTGPNNGEGFSKNLGGKQLPNAPHFTTALSAEYTLPVSDNWAATLHTDFYWQSQSWARVFNDRPYDKIHGYSNVNLSLILTSDNGWQVMGYVKNVFDTTAITGDFLNSDDSGLTTNVFLTDPRLYGVRVTKLLDDNDGFWGSDWSGAELFDDLFADKDGGKPPLWITLGGQLEAVRGRGAVFTAPFMATDANSPAFAPISPTKAQQPPLYSLGEEASVTYQPDGSDWLASVSIRYGRSGDHRSIHQQTKGLKFPSSTLVYQAQAFGRYVTSIQNYAQYKTDHSEQHEIFDFKVGKDVGLGSVFGSDTMSELEAGLRVARIDSSSSIDIKARPDFSLYGSFPLKYWHNYSLLGHSKRSFHGIGPTVSWTGTTPLATDSDKEGFAVDWGVNAAVLFGRQKSEVHHNTTADRFRQKYGGYNTLYQRSENHTRSRTVSVPNLGGFAGISYRYANAKISLGYRADFFFGAIDGGIDKQHSETFGTSGPFATISFGIGG